MHSPAALVSWSMLSRPGNDCKLLADELEADGAAQNSNLPVRTATLMPFRNGSDQPED